jgi:hypothetical protein
LRDHLADRIAGETEHRKRDDPDGDHDTNGLKRAAQCESEHGVLSPIRLAEMKNPGA